MVVSPLAQGRGLKRRLMCIICPIRGVAPRAGAWIETHMPNGNFPKYNVAPRAGAWIETNAVGNCDELPVGRPSRRGVD